MVLDFAWVRRRVRGRLRGAELATKRDRNAQGQIDLEGPTPLQMRDRAYDNCHKETTPYAGSTLLPVKPASRDSCMTNRGSAPNAARTATWATRRVWRLLELSCNDRAVSRPSHGGDSLGLHCHSLREKGEAVRYARQPGNDGVRRHHRGRRFCGCCARCSAVGGTVPPHPVARGGPGLCDAQVAPRTIFRMPGGCRLRRTIGG